MEKTMSKVEIKKKKKQIKEDADFEKELQEDAVDKNKVKEMLMSKMKKKESEMVELIQKQDRALNWFVVGCGQGGSRIAETFYDSGYESVVINTAEQDLTHIQVPTQNKLLLKYALDGAAKDISMGEDAFLTYQDEIDKFIQGKMPEDTNMIILSVTGGGGTGSGSVEPMIDILKTYQVPLIVLYVLPLQSDDVTSKNNSLITLAKLAKYAKNDVISSLMVVDNAKIETLPYLKQGNFWSQANSVIVEPLHMFNMLSVCASNYTSLDPMDTGKLLTTGDCCIYGQVEVEDYMEETALAEAVMESLESGLLAGGFDLTSARAAGIILLGSKDILDELPAVNVNYAYAMINEVTNNATVYRGMYEAETDGKIKIFAIFSGLGLPESRIDALKLEAKERMKELTNKEEQRGTKMEMSFENDAVKTDIDKIHQKIKKKKSAFNKLANTAMKGRLVDRRKR